jgi:hypothetical protein
MDTRRILRFARLSALAPTQHALRVALLIGLLVAVNPIMAQAGGGTPPERTPQVTSPPTDKHFLVALSRAMLEVLATEPRR